jgi:molybdopterin-guanine dinucleotide biosynthesis protein A
MCARYGPDVQAAVDERLAAGGRSLRDLLETMAVSGAVAWVEPAEWEPVAGPEAFSDVDTPEDLHRLREDLPSSTGAAPQRLPENPPSSTGAAQGS